MNTWRGTMKPLNQFNQSALAKAAVVALAAFALAGCGDDNDDNTKVGGDAMPSPMAKSSIVFTPKNLAPLGDEFDYEGWLITPNGAVATGKFDITAGSEAATQTFMVNMADAKAATKFVLTIEPQTETGADIKNPTNVHILGGDIMNSTAMLSTQHSTALSTDFSSATAKYKLATPTNGNTTPTQGIWFLDDSSGTAQAGLNLPALPAGWKYEGWVVDGTPLSTGTFLKASEADSDGAGSTAGNQAAPAFPGQDYVNPAKDLVGKTAVISVEPDPDNSTAPFSIKPLVGVITNEAGKMMLKNKAADSLPSATISITHP